MHKLFLISVVSLLASVNAFAQANVSVSTSLEIDPLPAEVILALAKAHADGVHAPCTVHKLTISGSAAPHDRPFSITASPDNLLNEFKSAFSKNERLSIRQAKALTQLTKVAKQTRLEAHAINLSALQQFSDESSFSVDAKMLCLSPESLSTAPKAKSITH